MIGGSMSRRHRLTSLAAAGAAVACAIAGTAVASFASSASAPHSVSTATLAAPTGLATVHGTCDVLSQARVTVTWVATASGFADGYEIFRGTAAGGPYSSIATVSGHATVAYTDATVAFATDYWYVVKATRNAWRSPNSGQATIKTKTSLCAL